jgi:hypothetical protein
VKRLPIDIIRQFLNAWSDGPEPLEKAIRDLFRADTEIRSRYGVFENPG